MAMVLGDQRAANDMIVVTGASGFIGHALASRWASQSRPFRGLVRSIDRSLAPKPHLVEIGDLAHASDGALAQALDGASAVVHLAARAHVMSEPPGAEAAYREANVVATERLARAALRAGVERFVFASSVKVHGEASPPDRALRPDDPLAPHGPYATTKRDAEDALRAISHGTPMTPLALRLPLVYGPGVKGNFLALLDAIAHGRRLPFASIAARRSVAFVGNVIAALEAALAAPRAPTGAHFVADPQSVTAGELARAIGDALGRPARLFAMPESLLRIAGALTGRGDAVARLVTPLEVDTSSFAAATGFAVPYTLTEGLAATAAWWRAHHAL